MKPHEYILISIPRVNSTPYTVNHRLANNEYIIVNILCCESMVLYIYLIIYYTTGAQRIIHRRAE